MEIETIMALIAIIVTLLGLLVVIQNNARQLNVQSFIKFTEKFDKVEEILPDIWKWRNEKPLPKYESNEELLIGLRAYVHLCSQEFYLYIHGHISSGIWSIWEQEIEQNFRGDLLNNEWQEIQAEFSGYTKFYAYINALQMGEEKHIADKYCVGVYGAYVKIKGLIRSIKNAYNKANAHG